MRILRDFFHLFYPKLCGNCEEQLVFNEKTICTLCRHDLPLTNFLSFTNNSVTKTFYGRIDIEKGYALLFFRKEGITQKLIHELKYRGNEEIGELFGNWIGEIIIEKEEFKDVDHIIPVPLHPKKLKKRGYNQSEKFAKGLSKSLNINAKEVLERRKFTETQTKKSRLQRLEIVDEVFDLKDNENINGLEVNFKGGQVGGENYFGVLLNGELQS